MKKIADCGLRIADSFPTNAERESSAGGAARRKAFSPLHSAIRNPQSAIRRVRASCRAGFTLLEVILALTIFFGALTALSQLAWNGSRAALQARLKTQAIVRCEAKLAEVLAGVEALQPKTRVPFPDNAQWTYSVSISDSQYPDLLQLQVTVAHTGNSSLASAEFSLWRWMRDPSLFLEAAELQQTEADKESQSQGATQ